MASEPSLFEWAGGMPAFERLTAVFYARVREDPLLAPLFARASPEHPAHVAAFIVEVFGGPSTYTPGVGTRRWCAAIWVAPSPRCSGVGGLRSSPNALTKPACQQTPNSGQPSSPTSNGGRASR